jgi:outer membrane protein
MNRLACSSLVASIALSASPALAQDQEQDRPLILSIGAGVQFTPQFPGSEELEAGPLFTGFSRREGDPIPFRTPDDGIGPSLIGRGGPVEIGPLIQFQSKRDEEDVGAPVGDVDFTVEAGAFANINISRNFRLRLEAQRGINGHESWVGTIAADVAFRSGLDTLFTIGPRVRINDEDYMDTYFGVTPAAAAASGLPAYDPDGGVRAVGAVAGVTHQISRRIGVYAYAGYDRLVGDAADSPIVQLRGSPDQFSAGVALFFSFQIGNLFD